MHAIRGFKADSKPARKLTPARIVKALRAGAHLCAHHGAKITYSLQPPGVRVPVKYARGAIRSGELVAAHDGLLPGATQSWEARPPAPAHMVDDAESRRC